MIDHELLRGIDSLPVPPLVWQRVLLRLEDQYINLGELEDLIRQDQALSARLLATANSAFYGFGRPVTSVRQASLLLGLDEVRRVCLGAGLAQLLWSTRGDQLHQAELLWRHSLQVAEASGLLARARQGRDAETAFTAGMLHDLGKVLLALCFPSVYAAVADLGARLGLAWGEAEDHLGLDHQDLGLHLAELWRLPPSLAEVIGRHHQPQPDLAHYELVALVHLADWLVWDAVGRAERRPLPELYHTCATDLGLGPRELERCRRQLEGRLRAISQTWGGPGMA